MDNHNDASTPVFRKELDYYDTARLRIDLHRILEALAKNNVQYAMDNEMHHIINNGLHYGVNCVRSAIVLYLTSKMDLYTPTYGFKTDEILIEHYIFVMMDLKTLMLRHYLTPYSKILILKTINKELDALEEHLGKQPLAFPVIAKRMEELKSIWANQEVTSDTKEPDQTFARAFKNRDITPIGPASAAIGAHTEEKRVDSGVSGLSSHESILIIRDFAYSRQDENHHPEKLQTSTNHTTHELYTKTRGPPALSDSWKPLPRHEVHYQDKCNEVPHLPIQGFKGFPTCLRRSIRDCRSRVSDRIKGANWMLKLRSMRAKHQAKSVEISNMPVITANPPVLPCAEHVLSVQVSKVDEILGGQSSL